MGLAVFAPRRCSYSRSRYPRQLCPCRSTRPRVRMDVAVRTEAVLLQQVPISSLALSLQEHPPRVRMDVAVHTEAVLLQQVPISSLALSLQEHPPRVRMGLAVFAPRRCSYSRSRYPR